MLTREQLRRAGLSDQQIKLRVAAGRLIRLHRGVYALAYLPLTREGRWLAAVLACGAGAVLSHQTAATVWGLWPSNARTTHVSIPSGRGRRAPDDVRLHRHAALHPHEVAVFAALPVTTVARTLLDLAAALPRRPVELAIDRAHAKHRLKLPDLEAVADGRAGTRLLKEVLADHVPGSTHPHPLEAGGAPARGAPT